MSRENFGAYMTTPPMNNGDKPVARRIGTRTMLPSTWVTRSLRIEYTDASGRAATTQGTLLDWCPVGPILHLAGSKTIISWDRLILVELAGD
jgi:hypothetical protein